MSNQSRFASEEIQDLFAAHGLCSLDDAFRVGESLCQQHLKRATRHENKQVVKFDLSGPAATSVYIKRQWRRERWLPRPTDIRHRINLQCTPIHEWRGLRILQEAGFHVSEPLAVFWRGLGLAKGAIVTRAVPPQHSMADMLLSGEFSQLGDVRRESLIDAAVDVVARLHRAKISWRSMKAKHFYPEEIAPAKWRIWLIDCEGVYRHASRRDREREWQTYSRYFKSRAPEVHEMLLTSYGRCLTLKAG